MRRKPQRFLVVPLKRNLNNMSNVDIRDNIFYAVGTGPARSEFLTLQAVRVLEKCSTIFYPVTGKDEKSHIAFDCVCGAIDVSKKKMRWRRVFYDPRFRQNGCRVRKFCVSG